MLHLSRSNDSLRLTADYVVVAADQLQCQHAVVAEIGKKAEAELAKQRQYLDSAAASADLSRQESARLRVMHAKLAKVLTLSNATHRSDVKERFGRH